MIIQKTQDYLNYVKEHKQNVKLAWEEVQKKCEGKGFSFIYDDWKYHILCSLIEKHDDSKLSNEEFIPYRQKFYPCEDDNFDNSLFSAAWEHHKANNPHHWEHWLNHEPSTPYDKSMYSVEMVCDWMAMGYKFGDTAESFYLNNKNKIILPVSEDYIFEIFNALR
ncbi:MAG TPA: DUF5662 family protein [Clostridiaceae bacterium]